MICDLRSFGLWCNKEINEFILNKDLLCDIYVLWFK